MFEGFDRVMLLAEGEMAFLGTAASAAPYFTSIGAPPPPNANVAEFMLDEVNAEFYFFD